MLLLLFPKFTGCPQLALLQMRRVTSEEHGNPPPQVRTTSAGSLINLLGCLLHHQGLSRILPKHHGHSSLPMPWSRILKPLPSGTMQPHRTQRKIKQFTQLVHFCSGQPLIGSDPFILYLPFTDCGKHKVCKVLGSKAFEVWHDVLWRGVFGTSPFELPGNIIERVVVRVLWGQRHWRGESPQQG